MPRLISNQGDRTHPLVWLVAIILAILAVAVIITGIVVFVVYMVYKPKMPYIQVTYANLDKIEYDQSGLLNIQMTLTVLAVNDNVKADASFYDISFGLGFQGVKLAELRADPFNVPMNNSMPLNYIVQSSTIPLDEGRMESMDAALKQEKVPFMLYGHARTRWKVGIFLSIKFWQHLSCKLEFNWPGGSSIGLDCSSNSD
ncbi:uncharacterized protein LOC109819834 [Asparagus officinalis]|uniref:uncharacterized protein LOC109819834 n=1 Tax=Asparagus officinalis TaxID=4686 RepID=UPI00098E276A|nr:uncharacterized protein LOC109819834 [Asparagus officinalis]